MDYDIFLQRRLLNQDTYEDAWTIMSKAMGMQEKDPVSLLHKHPYAMIPSVK